MSRQVYLSTWPRKNWLRLVPFADDFRPIDQGRIVHQRRAAFAAGGVVFGFMEAEAADMATVPNALPL